MTKNQRNQPPGLDDDSRLREIRKIEAAGFGPDLTLIAQTTVASLHYLRHLSARLDRPMEELNVDDILGALQRVHENQQ